MRELSAWGPKRGRLVVRADCNMRLVIADWRVPIRVAREAEGLRVFWQRGDGARFTEPFFDDTVRRLRGARQGDMLPPTPLDAWRASPDLPPVALIFHVSRCGSTLVSRMLASLPDNLVVSEARVVDDLLRGWRADPSIGDATRAAWLRNAVAAFAASQATPPARVVLKLDCWHIFDLPLVQQSFPDAPLVFVYRDPLEVLVSLMAQPSLTLVRGTVSPAEMGVSRAERDAMSREDHAAAILGAFFRHAARHRAWLAPIGYPALPAAVWTSLPWIAPDGGDVDRLRDAARADAKDPGAAFAPDTARKRASASPAVRDACARWAAPAYEAWLAAI